MRFSAVIGTIVILVFCISLVPQSISSAQRVEPVPDAETLNEAIDNVLQRRVYQWRMPRTEIQEEEQKKRGPIASFFKWLGDALGSALKYIGELIRQLIEWLENLIPESSPEPRKNGGGWMTPVRMLLIALLVVLTGGLVYGVFRLLKKRVLSSPIHAVAADVAAPDLAEEGISASELPADQWLGMAQQMIDKGDLRLAMRAFYLATLARLGDRELLTIEFYKSNLEYQRELGRRACQKNELRSAFSTSIIHFERIWYGLKEITRRELDEFARLQEKIAGLAENEPIS